MEGLMEGSKQPFQNGRVKKKNRKKTQSPHVDYCRQTFIKQIKIKKSQ